MIHDDLDTTDDRGISLIELLVYMLLSIVMLLIVGGLLINTLNTEKQVRSMTASASSGQVVTQSVAQGVRNASDLELTAPSSDSQLLRTRSIGNAATGVWTCRAWFVEGGSVWTKTSSSAITAPSDSDLADWLLLADNLAPAGAGEILALTGRQVDMTFAADVADGGSTLFTTSAVSRQDVPVIVENPICF